MTAAEVKRTSRPEVHPIPRHLDSLQVSIIVEYYPSEILLQKRSYVRVGGRGGRAPFGSLLPKRSGGSVNF